MQFSHSKRVLVALIVLCIPLVLVGAASGGATTTVPLGSAGTFAILAGTEITDVPTSAVSGAAGVSPASGTNIGLSCAEVTGAIYAVDAAGPPPCSQSNAGFLTTATGNEGTAFGNAAGRAPDTTYAGADNQLGGKTLSPGVYRFGHATTANLIGNVTLAGDASSVWIFQASSDLVTAGSSTVTLTGGAQACNVFWQVGSSATLGGSSTLRGTVLAGVSITVGNSVTVSGRLLAQAAVTLDADTISRPACSSGSAGSSPSREIYCDPLTGKTYDLILGQDKQPPYDKLGLVPATVDPITGAKSCAIPAVAVTGTTTTSTTTTTTATTPTTTTPAPVAVKPTRKPAKKHATAGARTTKVAKHHAVRPARHVPPRPAVHAFGITG